MTHVKNFIKKYALVLLAGYAVFMVGIQRVPVPTVDGAIRADEAREVVRTGKWFPIVSHGVEVSDHPPLYIWLSAVSMKIFGVNDFAAVLPERLFAFLCILFTGMICMEAGLGVATTLLAVIILCLTRDFILSNVRGYIESMLSAFSLFGIWAAIRSHREKCYFAAFGSGIAIWLAVFAKGPPAFWPVLAVIGLYLLMPVIKKGSSVSMRDRLFRIAAYLAGLGVMTAVFIYWNSKGGHWENWRSYWNNQILESAVRGRSGAQHLEPFYFVSILWQYYWPWLPFAAFAIYASLAGMYRNLASPRMLKDPRMTWAFLFSMYALGYVVGFSSVKWKFWYYIAPAYPALAIATAIIFAKKLEILLTAERLGRFIAFTATVWLLAVTAFPVPLHLERAWDVMAFKDTIARSEIQGPVWFIHNLRDHNIVGSSGKWYFDRPVLKITDADEKKWVQTQLKAPAWILTPAAHMRWCSNPKNFNAQTRYMNEWCMKSKIIAVEKESALVLYEGGK